MKRLFSLWSLCIIAIWLVSCEDDKLPLVDNLLGTYPGATDIKMNRTEVIQGVPMEVNVARSERENELLLNIRDLSFGVFPIGNIVVSCTMYMGDKAYTLSGSLDQKTQEYGIVPVSVSGNIREETLDLTIRFLLNEVTVEATFKGERNL